MNNIKWRSYWLLASLAWCIFVVGYYLTQTDMNFLNAWNSIDPFTLLISPIVLIYFFLDLWFDFDRNGWDEGYFKGWRIYWLLISLVWSLFWLFAFFLTRQQDFIVVLFQQILVPISIPYFLIDIWCVNIAHCFKSTIS